MNKVERKNIKKKDLNSNIQQIIIYLFFLFDNVLDYYNKGCAFCMEKLLEKTKYKIKNNIIGLQEILKIEESFSLIYFFEKKIIFLEFLLKKNEREEVDIFEKEKFSVIFKILINYCFLLKNAIKTSFLFKVKIDFLIIEKRVLNELFIVYSKYKVFAKKINPEGVVKIKKFVKKEKKKN